LDRTQLGRLLMALVASAVILSMIWSTAHR
jgi:hypothetical protein